MCGDIFVLNIAYILAHIVKHNSFEYLGEQNYQLLWFNLNIFWLLGSSFIKVYDIDRTFKWEKVFYDILKLMAFQAMLTSFFIIMVKGFYYSREHFVFFYLIFIFLLFAWRFFVLQSVKRLRFRGYNLRPIVVVGLSAQGYQFMDLINNNPEFGYKFMGFFDDRPKQYVNKDFILGSIAECEKYCLENNVREVYCALPLDSAEEIQMLMKFCDKNVIRFKILPDFRSIMNRRLSIDFYESTPVMLVRNEPLENLANRALKRSFDFIFSSLVLALILSWIYPIVAALIKLTSKGPVFFKQNRTGYQNQAFSIYKFRTMEVNNDADSQTALINDPRITKVGMFLRKTHIDEIPQFINVFLGQMSVVGPRPRMLVHTKEYSKMVDRYMVRHFVKPGVTGLSQVKGLHEDDANVNHIMLEKWVTADVEYIENWDLLLDLKIIYLTIKGIVTSDI
ncbi:MAG: undecaprenyl-phosphate glucose phosphotransferase [Chitinophagales bacterium]|nr:undecaprenyl-phosphate glucose phosphotransferase [Chitinophagales bacterium]